MLVKTIYANVCLIDMEPPINNTGQLPIEPNNDGDGKSTKSGWKSISSTIALLITAPLLALFITSHVFHSYEVDGQSMFTTLENGDRLIVNKVPKSISNITNNEYIPGRYDIIVFDRPKQIGGAGQVNHLIKRVIGLPGERVTVKNGKVTVYNKDSLNGFDPDTNQEYAKDITTTPGDTDITVGQNEVFVLGDNRTNSSDSRVFGAISVNSIVGKATLRFIPVNDMRRL